MVLALLYLQLAAGAQVSTSTATTTPGPIADYLAPTQTGSNCYQGDSICDYSIECEMDGYEMDCESLSCEDERSCSELGDHYVAKKWNGTCEHWPDYSTDRYNCCRCKRSVPSYAAWEMLGTPGNGACRGRTAEDNLDDYYTVHHGVVEIEDCKALCLQHFPSCKGIEYSLGHCEIWTRPEGICQHVELPVAGFSCLRFGWAPLVPVDGGEGRACRGDHSTDNDDSYYVVVDAELEDCKARCVAAPLCLGIEWSPKRCELWQRPIHGTADRPGFTCLAFEPSGLPLFTRKLLLL
ncbi:unnamed protein product [Effrenium voratum]|uniref:Apple domain-containing protein n=1 Tax=Effrenium voratum TaxID=2562239 RepID=A0AA36MGL0_9DINO|nr:unnamed protein product [Effrenium voratum]